MLEEIAAKCEVVVERRQRRPEVHITDLTSAVETCFTAATAAKLLAQVCKTKPLITICGVRYCR